MKIVIAADHAGWKLKNSIKDFIKNKFSYEIEDFGTHSDKFVDYPDFARIVSIEIEKGNFDRGILICGTGIGMCMTANKFKNIRAALCHNEFTSEMSRRHNDANVLCLGARVLDETIAKKIVEIWLKTPFDGGRHERRTKKISDL